MATAELRYSGPEGADGAVLGAVEIIDEELRIVTGSVVTARQPIDVQLLPGRYLARGWLPSGPRVRTMFETADTGTTAVELRPLRRPPTSATRPAGWLRSWFHNGRTWEAGAPPEPTDAEPGTIDVIVPAPAGATSIAVQIGADDRTVPPLIIVAPPSQAVRLRQETTRWRVGLPADLGSTLLAYMHRSDFAAADIVVRYALDDRDQRVSSKLADLVVGYYLVQADHDQARSWIDRLLWTQPDSVDVAMLNACLWCRDRETSVGNIVDEFLRAAAGGLPLLARGLHMLNAGLAATDSEQAEAALARLRPYSTALGDSPLTTFPAIEPDQPMTRHTAWSTSRPMGAVPVPALPVPTTAHTPDARGSLEQILELLNSRDVGRLGTGVHEVTDGDVALTATVSRSLEPEAFDLELIVDEPRGSLADVVVDLRVNSVVHFLATFGSGNRCTFVGLQPGAWSCTARTRTPSRSRGRVLPLPQPAAEMTYSAADSDGWVVLMHTMLPLNGAKMLLQRSSYPAVYRVELVAAGARDGAIMGVEYGRVDGTSTFRLVPYPDHVASSAILRLDGYDVRQPWKVFPEMTPAQVEHCLPTDITASVDAADNAATVEAWLRLAAGQQSGVAEIIRTHLDKRNRS